jgi:hypothetical protein
MSSEVTLLPEFENVDCSSAYLWQLMRCTILQLLKNLRFHSHGKEITDADILEWANSKVSNSGSQSRMDSFKVTIFIALFLSWKRLLQVLAFAV